MIRTMGEYAKYLIQNKLYNSIGLKFYFAEILLEKRILSTAKEYLEFIEYKGEK